MADEMVHFSKPTSTQPRPAQPPSGPLNKPLLVGTVVLVLLGLIGVTELTRPKPNSESLKRDGRGKTETSPASSMDITNFERQTQQEAQELTRIQAQKEALQRTLEAAQQIPAPNLSNTVSSENQAMDVNTLATLQRQQQLAAAGYYQMPSQQVGPGAAEQEAAEGRKQEEQALHASNVALDLKGQMHNSAPQPSNSRSTQEEPASAPDTTKTPGAKGPEAKPATYDFDSAKGKPYRLFEGTIIETVLTNRINGAFTGPVNCMVTTNVYAHDNQTVLIPQGSRVLGQVSAVANGNQQRLFVAFHRIIMPDGYSASLDQFTGLNQVGETGLRDIVNHHYLQIFGSSLAIAAIGGVAQIGNGYGGFGYDPMVVIRSGVSQSMAESSARVLDHFLNQLPTFIVRERARVKIYLAGDLLLPAYQNHTMPGDL
jgi:type IV secretion system protein VirB10